MKLDIGEPVDLTGGSMRGSLWHSLRGSLMGSLWDSLTEGR